MIEFHDLYAKKKRGRVPRMSGSSFAVSCCGRSPLGRIRCALRNISFAFQRLKFGWCHADAWSIDSWFLSVMPSMIDRMVYEDHSYPHGMRAEEWRAYLKKMAHLFREAGEDSCSMRNPYWERYVRCNDRDKKELLRKKWLAREKEISGYRDRCMREAMAMFTEHFWDMWD